MGFDNLLLKVDETLTNVLGQWDIYSTSIAAVILVFFSYRVFSRRDPDAHPMLLARQAQASPVRQSGESAVYRSHASPHGMDLNSGLNVKDPGTSKWARGRDGDLRDVWRKIVGGRLDADNDFTGEKGRILTALGTEKVIEHDLDDVSRKINIIGQYLSQHEGTRVAVYLPNSIELLITLFACSFYDQTPILLPFDQAPETVIQMLKMSKADSLVAAVGTLPFDGVTKGHSALRHLIWVVDEGSKHLDWNEIPKGTGGKVNVATWQEIVEDQKAMSADLPAVDASKKPRDVVAFWQAKKHDVGQMIEYTHGILVSAISAQINSMPAAQRVTPSDMVFPANSLSNIFTLVVTLAALYYNASLALNAVAGPTADLALATRGISPTIIVASASTISQVHREASSKIGSSLTRFVHWLQTRSLTQDGVMPVASFISSLNDSLRPAIGTTPGKLRCVFVSEQAGTESTPLTAMDLSDMRIFTGARFIYALTAPKVAGSVAQTTYYDYRVAEDAPGKHSHFGAPVTSVEVYLKDTKEHKTTNDLAIGEIIVRGPAVVGGQAALGVIGTIRPDNTLAYV